MKRILIVVITLFSSIIALQTAVNAATESNVARNDYHQELVDIGVSVKNISLNKRNDREDLKFKNLSNIYYSENKTVNPLKSNELKIIPFKSNERKGAESLLREFISKYVTSEFEYKVNQLSTDDTREIVYTDFSIFNDGEWSAVEKYAVVKSKNRYLVVILGYLKPFKGENPYQDDYWKRSLLNLNFSNKYNENDINNF